jgi:hypothetical protein
MWWLRLANTYKQTEGYELIYRRLSKEMLRLLVGTRVLVPPPQRCHERGNGAGEGDYREHDRRDEIVGRSADGCNHCLGLQCKVDIVHEFR